METQEVQRRSLVIEEALGASALQGWRKRMKEGVLVDLQIKRWRGRKKLDLLDLGIALTDPETERAYRDLLKLGSKLLLPQEVIGQLDSIERYARQILAKYAFSTPWGYFLPYSTYSTWRDENEKWQKQYFELRDDLVARYPEIVAQLLAQYETIGRHAYQLMLGQVPGLLDRRGLTSEEAFLAYFQDEIRAAIPSPEQISDTFLYDHELRRIEPDLLAPQSQRVDDEQVVEASMEATQARQEEMERERQVREEAEVQARAMRRYEEEMTRMNLDLARKAQSRKEQAVEQFFGALMGQLRELTYEVATDVLESIKNQDGESIRGRSVMQLRNLIDQVKNLNFYSDIDIDIIMGKLQVVVDQKAQDRDVRDIQRQLRAIALVTRRTLLELGQDVRSERERGIGIPDVPDLEEVREARLELDLPLATGVPVGHGLREAREIADTQSIRLEETDALRTERS